MAPAIHSNVVGIFPVLVRPENSALGHLEGKTGVRIRRPGLSLKMRTIMSGPQLTALKNPLFLGFARDERFDFT